MKRFGKKANFAFAALAILVVVAASRHAMPVRNLQAAQRPQVQEAPQEGKGCTAPKSWGELKGVADRAIAFEDASGTIRVLDTGPCMRGETQLIVKITRP